MQRLIRTNLTPIALVLLAVLPAVMGMSAGLVRCEHPGADTHLAVGEHAASPDDADHCCDHDPPADPDRPDDHGPCNDTPLEIELAPLQHAQHLDLGFADLPPLPVPAWAPADLSVTDADTAASRFDLGPPALCARLAVVDTTILRL